MREILIADPIAKSAIVSLQSLGLNVHNATNDLRNGIWKKGAYAYGMGLAGNTLGILGFGAMGQSVAEAARGLGMDIVAWSQNLSPKKATGMGIDYCSTAQEVARRSDFVSIHLSANSSTYRLVNRRFLQQMRDGAYLVNTSRGEIIDTDALKEAIYQKGLRVALDVFEHEPSNDGHTFKDPELAQVIVATPHIAASTRQAVEEVSREVVRIIGSFIASGMPLNAINAPAAILEPRIKGNFQYAY